MATYVNDLRLKEIATGDESGTWGTSTNTNLELIAEAFSYGTEASFSSDADATSTIADGSTDPVRSLYLKVTSSATLTATRTLTIAPNTVSKVWIIENATTGSQSINISQGSGANVTIPNGQVKVVYSDGAGSGAAVVDALTDLELSATLKVGTNLTVGGTYTGGGLMTTGGNIVIPNAGNIGSASDTDAIAIASSGVVTFSQIPLFSLGLGATSFNDNNITNVGNIALDSISSDAGTTVTVTLGTDAGDDFLVGNNNAFTVTGDNDRVGIGTADPSVALDVGSETDAILIAKGTTAQRPTGAAGQFRYNTTLEKFEGYTTEWGEIGGGTSTNTFTTDILAGDGSTTAFTISQAVDENNLVVFIDGVFQAQDAYSVSGTTLTMSAAPANGAVLTVYSVKGAVAGSNFGIATMTGDNSDTTLTLPFNPVNENNVQVYIDGVYQNKDTFSVSGTTLTFSTAPPTGTAVEAMVVSQTSVNTATILKDADEDTSVQVEESTDEDKIRFDTAGSERMIIDNSGNVGVGTTSPDFLMDIEGSNTQFKVGTASQDGGFLTSTDNNQLIASGGFYYNGSNFIATATSASGVSFDNGGTFFYNNTSLTDGNSFTLNETVRITDAGNVGIGQTSPTVLRHVTAADGVAANNYVAAFQNLEATDGQSFGVAIQAGSNGTDIPLNISTHDAGTTLARLRGDADLTIGTSTATASFYNGAGSDVGHGFNGTGGYAAHVRGGTNTPLYVSHSGTGSGTFVEFYQSTSIRGSITTNGSTTAYNTSSDYRLKENVIDLENATSRINSLRPVNFDWIESGENSDGFIAHEAQSIVPYAVEGTHNEVYTAENSSEEQEDLLGTPKYQAMDYGKLTPLLVKALQESNAKIEALETRIETLENA